jgi:hypothetical protein
LLILPVYAGGAVPRRRAATLVGWTGSVLAIEKVVQDVALKAGLSISLEDVTGPTPLRVLPRRTAARDVLRTSTTLHTYGRR